MKLAALCIAAACAATLTSTRLAAADTTPITVITQIKVVDVGDSNYKLFHGALWLEHDKATFNYRWGGEHCNGEGLSDLNVTLLFSAFRSKDSVSVDYKECKHQKRTYRCITGFSVTR